MYSFWMYTMSSHMFHDVSPASGDLEILDTFVSSDDKNTQTLIIPAKALSNRILYTNFDQNCCVHKIRKDIITPKQASSPLFLNGKYLHKMCKS